MFVSKKKWNDLEKRIAALEREQLENMKIINDYIKDNETLSASLSKEIENLPSVLFQELSKYGFNK